MSQPLVAGPSANPGLLPSGDGNRLPRPIIIIGCNRSGTTLLFNNLSAHPKAWSLYIEGQDVFHRHFPIDPEAGELVSASPSAEQVTGIRNELYVRSHNKEAFKDTPLVRHIPIKLIQRPVGRWYKPASVRLVEKTPANSLRVPMLHGLFPDARFLFLVRRGEDVVSSLMEGWKNWSHTGPTWRYTKWHYLAPPGWQTFRTRRLEEICAFQWVQSTLLAWQSLNQLPQGTFMLLKHEELMSRPREEYARILEFCELSPSPYFQGIVDRIRARVYTTGGSQPRAEKWRELHETEIQSVRHLLTPVNTLFYS